ncbi:MAG: ABC transporter [Planctomyces sp.]|nr:ABC transporter [Planctomyces sp.]
MSIIEAKHLTKTYQVFRKQEGLLGSVKGLFKREYKTVEAVRDVRFSIEKGEMVAFLGANGAGKTTTLKLLSGLIHPSSGEATVLGHVPWKRENAYRRRFSLVMGQKNQLWWDLPAVESFRLHQEIYRIDRQVYDRRLDELTSLLEVKPLIRQAVRELSLGERMRMELIAALLHAPEVLLLDEPTIGLDVVSQRRVQEFLKYYQQSQQITVILTSHYMKDVQALCKRAIIISGGTLRYDGPLAELVERFSQYKLLSLQFAGDFDVAEMAGYGRVIEHVPPRVKLEVPRHNLPELLSHLLAKYTIEDLEVQERPLEDVIAEVFIEAKATAQRSSDSE